MPFVTIKERTATVQVRMELVAAPVVPLRWREGGISPTAMVIMYTSPVGGSSWSVQALLQGTRTHPFPGLGDSRSLTTALVGDDAPDGPMPDWVAAFVDLEMPDASLRGAS